MTQYDVIIIGGGPGGYNAAIRAGQLGLKVACIEGASTLGGTCLNVGCMPSKALLHASELYAAATGPEFARLGIIGTPQLDLAQMMRQKDDSVGALTRGIEFLFRKYKAEWIRGWGRIDGPGRVVVRDDAGEQTMLETRHIVIATGSRPQSLPGIEIDQRRIVDSTGALSLASVPSRLVVIGAGVIGLELGSVWKRLGSEVTIVEFGTQIAAGSDAETARTLQRSLERQGIAFKLASQVRKASVEADGVRLELATASGEPGETLEADVVLVAVGRRAFTENLGLDSIGLATDARGRIEQQHHRTAVPNVWAIGDITSGPMLAHKAEEEAIACIELIAGGGGAVNYGAIPSVIYTNPELASVGRTEEQLKAAGVDYKVGRFPFTANSRAKINHETEGFVKVLADTQTDRVLGVHMVGPCVSELVSEYCLLMEYAGTASDVALTTHPHPTRSEALRQAAMAVGGWAMQA